MGEHYDEEIVRIVEVQDEIVARIVSTLSGRIKSDATSAQEKVATELGSIRLLPVRHEAFTSPQHQRKPASTGRILSESHQDRPQIRPCAWEAGGKLYALARATRGTTGPK